MTDPELLADVQRWLRYAKEDLDTAELMLQQHVPPRHVCLLAQQSAEKAIKAALFSEEIEPPRTHDLVRLCLLLPAGWALKKAPPNLSALSAWAVESRYPGDWPEATEADAKEAARIARTIWESINNDLRKFGNLV